MDGVSQQPAQAAPLCANAAAAPVSSSTPPRPNPVRVEALKAAIEHIQTKREQLERVPRPPLSSSAAEPVPSKPWVFCDGVSTASDDADGLSRAAAAAAAAGMRAGATAAAMACKTGETTAAHARPGRNGTPRSTHSQQCEVWRNRDMRANAQLRKLRQQKPGKGATGTGMPLVAVVACTGPMFRVPVRPPLSNAVHDQW